MGKQTSHVYSPPPPHHAKFPYVCLSHSPEIFYLLNKGNKTHWGDLCLQQALGDSGKAQTALIGDNKSVFYQQNENTK